MSFLETFLKQKMQSIEERKRINNLPTSNMFTNPKQTHKNGRYKNVFSIVMIFLICTATATLSVVLLSSLIAAYEKNHSLYQRLNSLEENIGILELENKKILDQVDSVKNNPQTVESILRNKYHFREQQEVILEEGEDIRDTP